MVKDLAGYLVGAYVVSTIRQCLLDCGDLLDPRLIYLFVQGTNLIQQGKYLGGCS